MNKAALLYLLPIVISLVISVGVTFYSWRRRKVIGASAFVWFIVAEIIYTVGYIWELLSVPFERILFWNHFRYTISTIAPLLLLHFSLEFTRRKLQYPIRTWLLVSIPASAFLLLLITDSYHRLIHPSEILLRHVGPFSIIENEFSLLSWGIIAYGFCVGLFCVSLIIDRFINTKQLFRQHFITILLGIVFPLAGAVIHVLEIELAYQIDPSYIAFAIGNLVIAWGLFRLKLFDIVPIAHDRLIEQMHDAVFVLDTQYRFVDINLVIVFG